MESIKVLYNIHCSNGKIARAFDREEFENILLNIIYGNDMSEMKRLFGEKTTDAILKGFEMYLTDHYTRTDLFRMGVRGNIKTTDGFIRDIADYVANDFITVSFYER